MGLIQDPDYRDHAVFTTETEKSNGALRFQISGYADDNGGAVLTHYSGDNAPSRPCYREAFNGSGALQAYADSISGDGTDWRYQYGSADVPEFAKYGDKANQTSTKQNPALALLDG